MIDNATEMKPAEACLSSRTRVLSLRWASRLEACDIATAVLIAALVVLALLTFKEYAISNDEPVQHHYGELILRYYGSGFHDQRVFGFDNLYLYGGLFDIIAVGLSHLLPIDPYELRHILCALIGVAGIGAAAATARLIAGPRAGLIAAIALSVCGVWYGAMFNHTKDIPFAAAMMGATLFLIRLARSLPRPRVGDIVAFGLLTGAALGMRVLGLLLVIYIGFAIALYLPRPWLNQGRARWHFVVESSLRLIPALFLAYAIMILAWPWAALAPLNPIRGLLAFSEFHYPIRTVLDGNIYEMAHVPRLYVPTYILIRVPLLTLFGAVLGLAFALLPRLVAGRTQALQRDIILIGLTVIFPLACQVICDGPAFTGLRHFLFVIPALAVLAGVGLDVAATTLSGRSRVMAFGALAAMSACFLWNALTLVELHPYEYLFYNPLVGGLQGVSRRYVLDYWFDSMPEAIHELETYVRATDPVGAGRGPVPVYSVAVCGIRLSFEKTVTLPRLRFTPRWDQSQFFIAPTHMNCDRALDGKVVGTVKRLGVVIAYVKDRRALTAPVATATR
ncbi:glycosyltransferase family 39 protein [Nitrobacter sp. NHB1]|uniref:glycosyltransferase family 39 protein n=1 Tax=Nitrobacter sp. NHB1 TaxID=3119830 RepID=UPI002FFE6B2B